MQSVTIPKWMNSIGNSFKNFVTFDKVGIFVCFIALIYLLLALNSKTRFIQKIKKIFTINAQGNGIVARAAKNTSETFENLAKSSVFFYFCGLFIKFTAKILEEFIYKHFKPRFLAFFGRNERFDDAHNGSNLKIAFFAICVGIATIILAVFILNLCSEINLASSSKINLFRKSAGIVIESIYKFIRQVILSIGFTWKQ